MKKICYLILLQLNLLFSSSTCCCEQLIDRLITTVEDKLDEVVDDDVDAIKELTKTTNDLNENYLSDIGTEIKSNTLDSKNKLNKFLIDKDIKHLYQACSLADGVEAYNKMLRNKTILDIIEKKLNSINLNKIILKTQEIENKTIILDNKKENMEKLKKILN